MKSIVPLASALVLMLLSQAADADVISCRELLLKEGWRFVRSNVEGAQAAGFDDSKWEQVNVPHCWNVEIGDIGDPAGYYEGAGWYRLHLKPDAALAGKSLFLKFDASYLVTEVFVNGQLVGTHAGGFAAFCLEVTSQLRVGQDNVVAVRVAGSVKGNIPGSEVAFRLAGMNGDFTRYPGLYRPVHLLALNPLSLSPTDQASSGVYLKQVRVSDESAELEVTAKLRNGAETGKRARVKCRIIGADGKEVQSAETLCTVSARGAADAVLPLQLAHPRLWNGCKDPYLYRAEVQVLDEGKIVDLVTQPLGVRYFKIDPERGFFLNGKPYPLHGVNRHQDRPAKGWALSESDMQEDVSLILELGATAVRLAHYQHSQTFYDLCDQAGLVVWSELCMVNYSAAESAQFVTNTRQQLCEMIRQNYNHPSVCFWSLWNELTFQPANKNGWNADKEAKTLAFLKGLNTLAKEMDPERYTTGASFKDVHLKFAGLTDVIGWNYYPGWYLDPLTNWDVTLPRLRAALPGRAIGVSEHGAGASIEHHELPPVRPNAAGRFHPEEWQALVHEAHYQSFQKAPYLWGTFVWNMFDFCSLWRKDGAHPGRNDKGLVTDDRKTRKDAFYFYQAQWTSEPMVHINSRRYNPRPPGKTEVRVYSNCDAVELLVNDRSAGVAQGDHCVFVWKEVVLREGTNKVEALGVRGDRKLSDALAWMCSKEAPAHMGPVEPIKIKSSRK